MIFFSSSIIAHPWEFSNKSVLDLENTLVLQRRYPDLKNQEHLNQLLEAIGKVGFYSSVKPIFKEERWVIDAIPAKIILHIDIKNKTQDFDKPKEAIKSKYLGKPDSAQLREKVGEEIKNIFSSSGFPQVKFQMIATDQDKGVALSFELDEGEMCVVNHLQTPFEMPSDFEWPVVIGDPCDLKDITSRLEDLESRMRFDGFQDVQLALDKGETIIEDNKMSLKIIGLIGKKTSCEILDKETLENLTLKVFQEIKLTKLSHMSPDLIRSEVITYYKNQGYQDVRLFGPYQKETKRVTHQIFYLSLGPLYSFWDLQIEGNAFFTEDEIKKGADLEIPWSLSRWMELDEDKIVQKIENFYYGHGFWDIKVAQPKVSFSQAKKMGTVLISIQEKSQRIFKGLEIVGAHRYKDELLKIIDLHNNTPLKRSHLVEWEDQIRSFYSKNGYMDMKITPKMHSNINGNQVEASLIFEIEEGEVVYFGTITLKGLLGTKSKVVTRELLFTSGSIYDPDKMTRSQSALMRLGIFKSVQFITSPAQTFFGRHEIDVEILLQEGDAGRVKFGPGFELTRGVQYVAELSYFNLRGEARQISLRAAMSEERQQKSIYDREDRKAGTLLGRKIAVGYVEPYIFDLPINANISLSHKATAGDLWKFSNSVELSLLSSFGTAWDGLVPFYRLTYDSDVGSKTQELSFITTGRTRVGSIGAFYKFDRRNDLSWPSSGYFLNSELSWARYELFSEFQYLKWSLSYSSYYKIMDPLVFAIGCSLTSFENVRRKGIYLNASNTDMLPSSLRLFAGDSDKVRGFAEQLGPYVLTKEKGDDGGVSYRREAPLGGTRRFVLKMELRHRVSEKVATALFLDSGNTFFSNDEYDKFSKRFASLKSEQISHSLEDNLGYDFSEIVRDPSLVYYKNFQSMGLSGSFLTPLGSLNASLAWPIREPLSQSCRDENICFVRARSASSLITKYKFELNIGAEF